MVLLVKFFFTPDHCYLCIVLFIYLYQFNFVLSPPWVQSQYVKPIHAHANPEEDQIGHLQSPS